MSLLWKLGIVSGLVLIVFGGGTFATYELFVKKASKSAGNRNEAVVGPTPDPGIALLEQGKQLIAKGEIEDGKRLLISLFQSFPKSAKADEARKTVGDMNIQDLFSSRPSADKKEYVVARGDSIAKIAAKTKAAPELIFKANGLDGLMIQPGQKFIIPSGQFTLQIFMEAQAVELLNHGQFFRWYKGLDVHLPPNMKPGQLKVIGKEAWSGGARVSFGEKKFLGSSRWVVLSQSGVTLYSETAPNTPNVTKPRFGIELAPEDMEELFALLPKETTVTVSK
ncbi:MAG TPA: LysM peptidoglycan-binding domain-containing protein [Chthoniobacterales bacterium]|nr:LysM peptidoglycan-binding domain-containing protein [Chthoniobacterales bacterium]